MRRGTPAAEKFGKLLCSYRIDAGLTLRQLGEKVGGTATTVYQIENNERALKEPKLNTWADALGISRRAFKAEWIRVQRENPDPPIVRRQTIKNLICINSSIVCLVLSGNECGDT